MRVSVIITTYKRPKKILARALDSVFKQTLKVNEIIIVDDSPSDYEGRQEIAKYVNDLAEKNVRLIQHSQNLGANAARNTGIENSEGSFIAFLDDDDEWYPEKIRKQLKLFENVKVGLVYCSSNEVLVKSGKEISSKIRKAQLRGNIHESLFGGNFIGSTSCAMFRKKALEKVGFFDMDLESAQDFEIYLRVSKDYLVDYVEGDPLIKYYRHDSDKISGNRDRAIRSRNYIHKKYERYLNENENAFYLFYQNRSKQYAEFGNIKLSNSLWFQACRKRPKSIRNNCNVLLNNIVLAAKFHIKKMMRIM